MRCNSAVISVIFIIYEMFPRWAKKTVDTVSVLLIMVFTTCLVWGGFNEAVDKYNRFERFGTAWDPPIPATVKPAILIVITGLYSGYLKSDCRLEQGRCETHTC